MSSLLPCIALTGGIMSKFISKYMQYVYFLEGYMNREFIQSQALT